jgi:hypothetical protein
MTSINLPEGEQEIRRFEGKNYWTQPQLEYIVTNRRILIRNKKTGFITAKLHSELTSAVPSRFFDITGMHWYVEVDSREGKFTIECKSERQMQDYLGFINNLIQQYSTYWREHYGQWYKE